MSQSREHGDVSPHVGLRRVGITHDQTIEPIDAPYTFTDAEGAFKEAHYSRRLGYRSKSLVRPDHAQFINAALTPSEDDVRRSSAMVTAFEAARARGEDGTLVDGLWVEVPTYRNALRTLERAKRLAA